MSSLFKHILDCNCSQCSGEMEELVSMSFVMLFGWGFFKYMLKQFSKNHFSVWILMVPQPFKYSA